MLPTTRESEKERPPDSENPSPPCTGSPPAWWMHGGRWWACCLRRLLLLLLLLRGWLRGVRSPTKPCASTAPGECRKGTETSIHGGEGWAVACRDHGQDHGQGGEDGARGFPGACVPSPLLPLLILRAPALLILLLSICPRRWPAWLPPLVLLRLAELVARGTFDSAGRSPVKYKYLTVWIWLHAQLYTIRQAIC